MIKQCKNFMECVESKIGNSKQSLFDGTEPDILYCSAFGDTNNAVEKSLTCGEEI